MKKVLLLLILLFSIFFSSLERSYAIGLPFGGYVLFTMQCTCSADMMVFMSPLYLNSSMPSFGILLWNPSSYAYSYNIRPPVSTSWTLGDYIPGVNTCQMVYGTHCAPPPLKLDGTISRYGISLP